MPRRDARIPKLAKLPSWEADCQELLYRFEEAVFTGAPMAFSTLRNLWQEMHFSFIFETRELTVSHDDFVQSLFSSALDCLEIPLRPRRSSVSAHSNASAKEGAKQVPQTENTKNDLNPQAGKGKSKKILGKNEQKGRKRKARAGAGEQLAEMLSQQEDPNLALDSGMQSQGLSIENLIPSDEEALEENLMEDEEEDHIGRVLASLGGSKKRRKIENPIVEPTNVQEEPDWGFLRELPDIAENLTEDLLEDPTPAKLPFNERTYIHGQVLVDLMRPQDRLPDAHTVRVGSIFLLYALYHAQPPKYKVRIYVALHLLRGLTWMCGQNKEVSNILKKLHQDNAFVVGAIRRPISGSKEAREAGKSVRSVIHPDQMEQNRLFKHALVQLNNSITDMESAQHVQLLCDSYKNAQRKLWEGNDDVKALFDLEFGHKVGHIVSNMRNDIITILKSKGKSKKKSLNEGDELQAAEKNAENPSRRPEEVARNPQDEKSRLEEAEERRKLRESQTQVDDEDMPSFLDLDTDLPGAEEDRSDSEVNQLPKQARLVVERQILEELEAKKTLNTWRRAYMRNNGLINQNPESALNPNHSSEPDKNTRKTRAPNPVGKNNEDPSDGARVRKRKEIEQIAGITKKARKEAPTEIQKGQVVTQNVENLGSFDNQRIGVQNPPEKPTTDAQPSTENYVQESVGPKQNGEILEQNIGGPHDIIQDHEVNGKKRDHEINRKEKGTGEDIEMNEHNRSESKFSEETVLSEDETRDANQSLEEAMREADKLLAGCL